MKKLIYESGGEDNVNQASLVKLKNEIDAIDREIEENNAVKNV